LVIIDIKEKNIGIVDLHLIWLSWMNNTSFMNS